MEGQRPDPAQIKLLEQERAAHDLTPLVIHDSYLINLAAPPSLLRDTSIAAFRGEIERALLIGAEYLVAHPGNYKGFTAEQGMLNVAEGLALAWHTVDPALKKNVKLSILLENTAGAGAQLGGKVGRVGHHPALGQSLFRYSHRLLSGYVPLLCLRLRYRHGSGLGRLIHTAEATLGLKHVPVMHANDAKTPLSSHLDRHANIGAGYIGLEGFRRILNHPKLQGKAFILETPVDKPGDDLRNVRALKELVSPKKRSITKKSSQSGKSAGLRMNRST